MRWQLLKQKGLLRPEPDMEDRRVMRIHLTEAARALHRDFQRQRKALSLQAVAGLDATCTRQPAGSGLNMLFI